MATRCLIMRPIQVEGQLAYQTNYIHSDGYPGGVGWELVEYYSDFEKRQQLFALGWLSVLGREIGQKHDFEWRTHLYDQGRYEEARTDARNHWCRAYHRDRGDELKSLVFASLEQASLLSWADYIYLWEDGQWKFFTSNRGQVAPYVEPDPEEEEEEGAAPTPRTEGAKP